MSTTSMEQPDWFIVGMLAFFAFVLLVTAVNAWHSLRIWYWHQYISFRVRRCLNRGDSQGALRILQRAIGRFDPNSSPAITWYAQRLHGSVLRQTGQHEEAIRYLRPLASRYAKHRRYAAHMRWDIAESLRAQSKEASAREERQIALELIEPYSDYASRVLSGRIFSEEKQYAEACEAFEAAISALPEKRLHIAADFLLEYAYALYYTHQYAQCQEIAALAIQWGEKGVRLVQANWIAGFAAMRAGNRPAARKWLEGTIAAEVQQNTSQHLSQCYIYLAWLSKQDGDLAAIDHYLREAEQAGADRFTLLDTKASCFMMQNRMAEAEEAIAQATALLEAETTASEEMKRYQRLRLALNRLWLFLYQENSVEVEILLDTYAAEASEAPVIGSDWPSPTEQEAMRTWIDACSCSTPTASKEVRQRVERLAATLETEAIGSPHSRTDQRNAFYLLALASLRCGAYALSLRSAEEYRARIQDTPLYMTMYYYLLGECWTGQGRQEEALAAWHQAVAVGLETPSMGRVRARLETAAL